MFDNLTSVEILFVVIIGFAICAVILWIWHEIIKSAVSAALKKQNEKQVQFLNQITRMMSQLLKANGVDQNTVIDALDLSKSYFLQREQKPPQE